MKRNLNSIIIGSAVVIAAITFGNAYNNRTATTNSISVTGLGSKDFVSDLIVWSGSFVSENYDLKEAYAQLNSRRQSIKSYLTSKGVKVSEMVFSAVEIEQRFDNVYDNNGNQTRSVFLAYHLVQRIQIESKEVAKIEEISRQVSELINSGIEFYSNEPAYHYTKLAELKVKMIAEATKDAKTRAEKIAENAGSEIGDLKKADMGVFQIVAQNSSEEYSWGGSYNTSSKRKTASITIKLEYATE